MNTPPNKHKDDFFLSFRDLFNIAKRNRFKIIICTITIAILSFLLAATKPIQYVAEGTFKERAKSQSGITKSLTSFFGASTGGGDEGLTILKSRKLMQRLIEKNGIQVSINTKQIKFPFPSWQAIADNLAIEYAYFKNRQSPVFPDPVYDINAENTNYNGELPLNLRLVITSPTTFTLFGADKSEIGQGVFNEPLISEVFTMTLVKSNQVIPLGKEYFITIMPIALAEKEFSQQLTVAADSKDSSLLKFSCTNKDRRQASKLVMDYMFIYKDYIIEEHLNLNAQQLSYLAQRKEEIGVQLDNDMQAYAKTLSTDLSTTGFASSSKAVDFLASHQQKLKTKLNANEMELQRLRNLSHENTVDYGKLALIPECEVINESITRMQSFKQEADSLNMALKNNAAGLIDFQDSFQGQLSELTEIQECIKEALLMQESLENDSMPSPFPRLLNNSQFVVRTWYDHLIANEHAITTPEWEQCKQGFITYLTHLVRYLGVYQRNLEARLANQQCPMKDFQGINLSTAHEFHMRHSSEHDHVENAMIEQQFMIQQLNDPDFEVSSLSKFLSDPVSTNMIVNASSLLIELKDEVNLSQKEQNRLKSDLAIQKGFLLNHLKQNIELLKLRKNFLKEKIVNLQNMTLSLIYEQISILESQIKHYVSNAIDSLDNENDIYRKNLQDLKLDMASFPQKWASERVIQQKISISHSMVAEITRLVESKSINDNLEKIQAAPLDLPITPILPKTPRLMMFTLIGAFLGALIGFSWFVASSVIYGVKVSSDNLKLAGQHVSGSFSDRDQASKVLEPLLDDDLNTLRRLVAYVTQGGADGIKTKERTLLLLENQGPQYAYVLADLMFKKGFKVLVMNLCFEAHDQETRDGLLQYLNGETSKINITHSDSYDQISAGGINRFANEFLSSNRFKALLEEQSLKYDWVIAFSNIGLTSAQADSLLNIFPYVAISIKDETLTDIRSILDQAKQPDHKYTFIIG